MDTYSTHSALCVRRQSYDTYHRHTHTHTHTHTIRSPSSPAATGKDFIHQWRLCEWNNCLRLAAQTHSHLISLTGYSKGSDSLLAVNGVAGVMGTYLWLPCVLCGYVMKAETHLAVEQLTGSNSSCNSRCPRQLLPRHNQTRSRFSAFFRTLEVSLSLPPCPYIVKLRRAVTYSAAP